jgi:hypothetical protein
MESGATDKPHNITWWFTANGTYSTRSAYNIQFSGSFADFSWAEIWKAKVENKCNFFSWLVL